MDYYFKCSGRIFCFINKIGNEVLNSILCHYMKICRDKHISFKVDIRKKLLQNLKYEELTSLFCNLLDNAVEACSDIPDSYIEMSVSFEPNSSLTVINIINTCRVVPTFDKNGRPVTTKKGSKITVLVSKALTV